MIDGDLRIAVVGAGRMGRRHLEACLAAGGVCAVAAVDPRPAVRAELEALGLATFEDVPGLLAAGGFDAAVIAAPSDRHPGLVQALAATGRPVLCEKPCGLTSAEAARASSAAEAAGVLLQVGYWRRFVPELAGLRRRIADGDLGQLLLVSCHQWDELPPGAEFRQHSGGIAIDMAVHEFDQLRWLTGCEIRRVQAVGVDGAQPADDPDVAAIAVALAGGPVGVVTVGRRFPQPDSCWLEAIGTRGQVHVPFMWGEAGDRAFEGALTAQLEAFAAAVCDGRPRGAGGADAAAALAAAELAGAELRAV